MQIGTTKIKTPKCTCNCPYPVHSHVGCMVKGCDCQHGIPTSAEQSKAVGIPEDELEDCPEHFIKTWQEENPGIDIEEFATATNFDDT